MTETSTLTVAVAKGRMLRDVLPILQRAAMAPAEDPDATRRLVLDSEDSAIRFMVVRSADVPTYVRFGVADLGIVGKDVVMEAADDIYEILDLGVSKCRMVVAQPVAGSRSQIRDLRRLRVATKYPRTTRVYFARRGIQVEVIQLYGSMELAPISGLADQIVDLVDTGSTLEANRLQEVATLCECSARLIANPAAFKMKRGHVDDVVNRMKHAITLAITDG